MHADGLAFSSGAASCDVGGAPGVALGFDGLVLLRTGANCIEDVLWAPVD